MRNLDELGQYRLTGPDILRLFGSVGDETCGAFSVPSPIDGAELLVIASAAVLWDHVSVSRQNRCPNWPEMEHVATLFFEADETAFQLHVPAAEHINNHPHCLHWWRSHTIEVPRPPGVFVGIAGMEPGDVLAALHENK